MTLRQIVQLFVPLAVIVLLPGVGFIAGETIRHGKAIAVQDSEIQSLDEKQAILDTNIQRQLTEIKEHLRRISEDDGNSGR